MAELNTVNVVVMKCGVLQSIVSFPDTPDGHVEADKVFGAQARRFLCPEEDIQACTDDGTYELEGVGLDIFLSHSTSTEEFLKILL